MYLDFIVLALYFGRSRDFAALLGAAVRACAVACGCLCGHVCLVLARWSAHGGHHGAGFKLNMAQSTMYYQNIHLGWPALESSLLSFPRRLKKQAYCWFDVAPHGICFSMVCRLLQVDCKSLCDRRTEARGKTHKCYNIAILWYASIAISQYWNVITVC